MDLLESVRLLEEFAEAHNLINRAKQGCRELISDWAESEGHPNMIEGQQISELRLEYRGADLRTYPCGQRDPCVIVTLAVFPQQTKRNDDIELIGFYRVFVTVTGDNLDDDFDVPWLKLPKG